MEEAPDYMVLYTYDGTGRPTAMLYREASYGVNEWDIYILETNMQGDVVAVYDESGTLLIDYRYDAWGSFSAVYMNGAANTSAIYNRLTYRGYYYDSDLGLYYLQSRYYDSNTGRFINADGLISTGTGLLGYNMYAYCNNNPVMYVDPEGGSAVSIIALLGIMAALLCTLTASEEQTMTLEQKQKVEAFVEKADMGPNEHNTSVNISFDTKEFIDVTPTNGLREYCYELLYERSVEEANQSGISKNNLMSIAHIRWETEVHLAFYGWLENSNKTELNVEENWYRLAKRFFRAVFGG